MASLKSLIPSGIMAGMALEALRKALVYGDVVNTDYQGLITGRGDSVTIPVIGNVSVGTHTRNETITYESLDATDMKLLIDQEKTVAFQIDDADRAQSQVETVAAYTSNAGYQLAKTADEYIAAMHAQATIASGLGTTAVPVSVTAKATSSTVFSVLEVLARINKLLDAANVPAQGRWCVVPPWFHMKLVLANIITLQTTNQAALTNGRITNLMGLDLRMSNSVVEASADVGSKIMAGTRAAISFASQLNELVVIEQMETKHAKGVRGLYMYGAKVVQPSQVIVATLSSGTE
jgi:hypothetical protein